MGIGGRLKELDDRVLGPPGARSAPPGGAVPLAGTLTYGVNVLLRGVPGEGWVRLLPGLVLVGTVLFAGVVGAAGRRRRGVPVADWRLVTAFVVAAVAGAVPALIPEVREWPLAPFVPLPLVLGVMWLTSRLLGGAEPDRTSHVT